MLTIKNPRALIACAVASNSLPALITWMTVIESRDDSLYTVEGVEYAETFHVTITFPNAPESKPMWGGLNYHDYGEVPYWGVNT